MQEILQELKDYIDELHNKIDYEDYVNLINIVDELDSGINIISSFEDELRDRQLKNLKEAIVEDAIKRKEKVIAVDMETFKEIKGKEIRLKITTSAIEKMKKDLKELEK